MKKYSQLVNKEFKVNKKKTFLSGIGILIGIVLLTFVVIMFNFNNKMDINSIKADIGEYSVRYNLDENKSNQIDQLNKNALVESYSIVQEFGNTEVSKDGKEYNIELVGLNQNAIDKTFKFGMDVALINNFPKSENEILLPKGAENLGFKIGDTINLNNQNKKIIGYYNTKSNNQMGLLEALTLSNNVGDGETFAYVNVKGHGQELLNNINSLTTVLGFSVDTNKQAELLTVSEKSENVELNSGLLNHEYGVSFANSDITILGFSIVQIAIILLVMLVSIVINFGFINFTLSSKVKQFGILRCIGATPKQIRNIVYKQVILLGSIIIVPAIFIGYILVIIVMSILEQKFGLNTYGTNVTFYMIPTIIILLVSILSIFVAALKPALKASRILPIQAIVSGTDSNKNLKLIKSKFIRKFMGIEAELAYRNLRAKSTAFWTSMILLLISFTTFICLTTYSVSMIKSISQRYKFSKEIELNLLSSNSEVNSSKEIYTKVLEENKTVKDYLSKKSIKSDIANYMYLQNPISMFISTNNELNENLINHEKFTADMLKKISYDNGTSEILSNGKIWVYDDEAFNLIKGNIKGSTSLNTFNKNGVIVIDSNRYSVDDKTQKETNLITPVFNKIKDGDKLDITFAPHDSQQCLYDEIVNKDQIEKVKGNNKNIQMEVLGTISPEHILNNLSNENDTLSIIISEDFFKKNLDLFVNDKQKIDRDMIDSKILFDFKTPEDRINNIGLIENELSSNYKLYMIDNAAEMLEVRTIMTMITVATYTFLAIIMIILVTTIIISKNLSAEARRKEFGTLLALGMDKKGLRKSVMFEAILQFIMIVGIGIPLSIIICSIFTKIPGLVIVNKSLIVILMIIAVILIFIITLMTSIIPFKKFRKMSMSQMMREEE